MEARYLSAEHARSLVVSGLREIEDLERVFVRSEGHEEPDSRRLQAVKARMDVFEFDKYRSMLDDLAHPQREVYAKGISRSDAGISFDGGGQEDH